MDKRSEFKRDAADLANEQLGNILNNEGKRILGTDEGDGVLDVYEAATKARIDPVTGLLSRSFWEDEMNAVYKIAVRDNNKFAIVMIDVDGLKTINDTNGHAAGDNVLRNLGRSMQVRFRGSDILGRFGGDEMIAMLPTFSIEPDQIEEEELDLMIELSKKTNNGVSVGIKVWDGKSSLEDTIKEADARLYLNKQNKKNA